MMCPKTRSCDPGASRSAVIVLVEKSPGLHRQMHLVLERRIAIGREQPGVVGDRFAERLTQGGRLAKSDST